MRGLRASMIALAVVAAACGSSATDDDSSADASATAPTSSAPTTEAPTTTAEATTTSTTAAPTTTTTTEPPVVTLPARGPEAPSGLIAVGGLEWQNNEVEGGELVRHLVATDDDVFVLAVLSQTLHQRQANGGFGPGEAIEGGSVWTVRAFGPNIYFAQSDGVRVRRTSGTIRHEHPTPTEAADVVRNPAGVVVVGFSESWVFDRGEEVPRATLPVFGRRAVGDRTRVWTIDRDANLHRIDAAEGTAISFPLPDARRPDASGDTRPFPNFVVTDDHVWVNGGTTQLLGVDKETGEIEHRIEVGSHGQGDGTHVPPQRSLALGFGAIFSSGPDGTTRIDLDTFEATTHDWSSAPIVTIDSLWVGNDDGIARVHPVTLAVIDVVPDGIFGFENLWAHGSLWSTDQSNDIVFEISWQPAE